jgi:hypothetical protein
VAAVAVREGRGAWRGEDCCSSSLSHRYEDATDGACGDGCCSSDSGVGGAGTTAVSS